MFPRHVYRAVWGVRQSYSMIGRLVPFENYYIHSIWKCISHWYLVLLYEYDMVHDIWNMQPGVDPRISVEVEPKGELIDLNANMMWSSLSSLDQYPRYMPLHCSSLRQVPVGKKEETWWNILVMKVTIIMFNNLLTMLPP